jgi:hypothetical protein
MFDTSTNTQNRMERVTRTITYMFQKPLIKSAICFSLLVLPAARGRQVVVAQGQTRRLVETGLRVLAVRPGTDTQEAQQPQHGDQATEIVDIHGALLPYLKCEIAVPRPWR